MTIGMPNVSAKTLQCETSSVGAESRNHFRFARDKVSALSFAKHAQAGGCRGCTYTAGSAVTALGWSWGNII